MEYAVKPLTSEDAEYMEERIDEFDDGILPPEPDAPEDEYLVLMAEDSEGNPIAGQRRQTGYFVPAEQILAIA